MSETGTLRIKTYARHYPPGSNSGARYHRRDYGIVHIVASSHS